MIEIYEHRLPITVNRRTRGGPGMPRIKIRVPSGQLTQVFNRSRVLNTYDLSYSMKTQADMEKVRSMYYIVNGLQLAGFRVRDWHDYQLRVFSSVLLLDDTSGDWQVYRRYTEGPLSYDRLIQKPNADLVVQRTRGAVTSTATATVDTVTGLVAISGHADGDTYCCTAGTFDVPVTFADDTMSNVEIDGYEGHILQAVPSIPLEELLL